MAFTFPKLLYDNRLKDATPVASGTASGFDVLNLRDFRPYTWWKADALPATVTVDCGSAKAVDYWGIWGHDLGTQGATIQLRGSSDNFAADDNLVDSHAPSDDAPFIRLVSSVSYRYWRFQIPAGASAVPSLAIALAGEALDLPVYLAEGFDPLGVNLAGDVNRSEKGHPLGVVYEFEDFSRSLRFPLVTWSWLRSTWEPAWIAHLRGSPHIFAWDAGDHSDEIALVNIRGRYRTPHQAGSYADLEYEVVGQLAKSA